MRLKTSHFCDFEKRLANRDRVGCSYASPGFYAAEAELERPVVARRSAGEDRVRAAIFSHFHSSERQLSPLEIVERRNDESPGFASGLNDVYPLQPRCGRWRDSAIGGAI